MDKSQRRDTARVLCYLGAFDTDYPRNQVIRAGLAEHGFEIALATLPKNASTLHKLPHLWRAMRRHAPGCRAFILAEFNQLLAPFAAAMGRVLRRPVLVDYLVGLYDAMVQDRNTTAPGSLRALAFRAVDAWNVALAPHIFTDTAAHREIFGARARRRLVVVPVGVYDRWWSPARQPAPKTQAPLLVQFFGNFIPFHGVEIILEAAQQLEAEARFHFELIGRGQTYHEMRSRAGALGLRCLSFVDPIPAAALPERVAQADICLGVFGPRAKTDYVVPNKIYQCLALGKPLITAESAAIREYFRPSEHLVTVRAGDPAALAAALRALADDPNLREHLGKTAAAHIRQHFTPREVVRPLLSLLDEARS